MIRGRTGHTGRGLDDIQAIHLAAGAIDYRELVQIPPPREFSCVANVSRTAAKEIRVERKNDVGPLDTINSIGVAAKSELRSFARAIANCRFPLVPFGLREKRQQRLNLRGKRWRSNNSGEDAESRAIRAFRLRREC